MLELHLLGLAGLFIHYLKEWNSANKKDEKYNLKKAIPMALMSAVTTGILIHIKDDIESIYPITRLSVVVLGYVGNSAFFSLMNTKKPKFSKEKYTS